MTGLLGRSNQNIFNGIARMYRAHQLNLERINYGRLRPVSQLAEALLVGGSHLGLGSCISY